MLRFSGPSPKVKLEPTLGLGPSSDVRLHAFQKTRASGQGGHRPDPITIWKYDPTWETSYWHGSSISFSILLWPLEAHSSLRLLLLPTLFSWRLCILVHGQSRLPRDNLWKKMSYLIILKNSVLNYVPIMVITLLLENSWSFPVGRDNPSPQKRSCSNSLLRWSTNRDYFFKGREPNSW